ncbi:MAG: DUF5698 domain-containing protein [Patescibacteria group bacterium]|jgi:uncharacterized protein YebE (UPF0316 family)
MFTLFFVGVLEMIIATVWTKTVTDKLLVASGVTTMVNILIWYYVLQQIVDNIQNWHLVILYALGCSLGTVICTAYYRHRDRKSLPATK